MILERGAVRLETTFVNGVLALRVAARALGFTVFSLVPGAALSEKPFSGFRPEPSVETRRATGIVADAPALPALRHAAGE